jgi:hypothetical protein
MALIRIASHRIAPHRIASPCIAPRAYLRAISSPPRTRIAAAAVAPSSPLHEHEPKLPTPHKPRIDQAWLFANVPYTYSWRKPERA